MLALALLPAPAHAAPKSFFGVVSGDAALGPTDFDAMQASRVTSMRFLLYWPALQPQPDQAPNFSGTDQLIGNLASHGITAVPFVWGSPSWVAANAVKAPVGSSHDRTAWKSFLRAAVRRYGPDGTYWAENPAVPRRPIRAWQIWNEPTLDNFFEPSGSAGRYARLVRISDQAIKSEDPHAKTVLAGVPGYVQLRGWKFLDRLYRIDGTKRHFDAVALHPYARNMLQLSVEIRRMRSVMAHHGDPHTPLWITELGWGSAHPDGRLNVGLKGQRRMLKRSFRLILRQRRHARIARLFWFQWRDPPPDTEGCGFCSSAGLLRANGDPKPAWQAFRKFTGATP